MMPLQIKAQSSLNNLLGLRLHRLFQVGDMTCFIFKDDVPESEEAEWALHAVLGWRLEYMGRTLTGAYDYFDHFDDGQLPVEDWNPSKGRSYLDHVLRNLLADPISPDEPPRDIINRTNGFVVAVAEAFPNGDCRIGFDNGYSLCLFPLAGRGEAWVVFQRGRGAEGFSMYMEDLRDDSQRES